MTDDKDNRADEDKREIVDADDLISSMGVGHTVDFQKISMGNPSESLTNQTEEPNSQLLQSPALPVAPTPGTQQTPAEREPRKPQQTSQRLAGLIQKSPIDDRKVPKTMFDESASKHQGSQAQHPGKGPHQDQIQHAQQQDKSQPQDKSRQQDSSQPQEISPAAPLKMLKSKVARTKLFKDDPTPNANSPSKGKKARRASQEFVAKTLLDHNVIIETQSRFGERQKERLEQEISKRQMEPIKIIEPIKPQKKARSCPFTWTEENAKERFKYCSNCQSNIYNFDGLEQAEAEALVFKRENREKFVLYGREDGKFMTSDCPFALQKRNKTIVLVSVCISAVACIIALLILMPKPPAHDPTTDAEKSAPPDTVSSDSEDSETSSQTDGSSQSGNSSTGDASQTNNSSDGAAYHYHEGDPEPSAPKEDSSKNPSENFSEQEQSGDFWQFDPARK